jgi:predicted aspartyl protease
VTPSPTPPYPSLRVRFGGEGFGDDVWALLDTGFDGFLAVPSTAAARWPQPLRVQRVRTASGEVVSVPVYVGALTVAETVQPLDALIIALGDEYLVGIKAVERYHVTLDRGRRVVVVP